MTSKYTYVASNRCFISHDVERVLDNSSRNMFAEILLLGLPPMEGALYRDKQGTLFVESVDLAFHPRACLFAVDYYKKLGAEVNTFAKEN